MQMLSYVAAGLAIFGVAGAAACTALAEPPTRISGPYSHENLAVYFIHGKSAPGPVPLTLQEALEKGSVRVLETGAVNELKIENTGSENVFIQSGDIVKGGRQDRVLTMSFVLPPKSGEIPLAAFCVEHGRWSARGAESAAAFSSTTEALPSREAKLAMRAPMPVSPPSYTGGEPRSAGEMLGGGVYSRQQEVWNSVAATQARLSDELSTAVASPQSETSLQLALENEKLQKARAAYIKTLQDQGTREDDIVGYALAINGRISSADVYPSNALFRKMWEKQLTAGVTEAIGNKTDAAKPAPASDGVAQFLAAAEKPKAEEQVVNDLSRQEVRDADKSLFVEAQSSSGAWVHRNYLAK
jgi:ARG and Rhodanese-Phosphatase-superfamily-associated Protein domain